MLGLTTFLFSLRYPLTTCVTIFKFCLIAFCHDDIEFCCSENRRFNDFFPLVIPGIDELYDNYNSLTTKDVYIPIPTR